MNMDIQQLRDYFTHDLKWGWGYQQEIIFSFLCQAAEESANGVVLDAGAGYQRYKPFFQNSLYLAQEHPIAGKKNKGIKKYDILSDVKKIPLADNSIDLILSTSSLEHIEFPELFFLESIRVLKEGGALYINVPFAYEEHEIPYDFQRLTRYGLFRYYANARFEKITVSPTSSSIYSAQYFFLNAVSESCKMHYRTHGIEYIMQKFFLSITNIICKTAVHFLDHGPRTETKFPIGWVAKGYKKGIKNTIYELQYKSTQDFLEKNILQDDTVTLRNGCVISAQKTNFST